MVTYHEWELLNEAVGTSFSLGLSKPNTVGGLVGSHNYQEGPVDLGDDEDEDEDYEEIDDEEGDEEETDLFGDSPDGPEKGFPPDDSESMDGLPTPDEEMLDGEEGGDEMDDVLAGINPDLAGLGDDEMGPEAGEMGPEAGEMGDELGMGDEVMGEPDIAAADTPCPECNPEGEMEEGEPDCEFCGGQGYVTDDQAQMPEDPDAVDAEIVDEDPESEMMDLMAKMQNYCNKYMPQYSRKFMDKDEPEDKEEGSKKGFCKGCGRPMPRCKCRKQCCKESNEFVNTLVDQIKGDVRRKYQSGLKEDALLQPAEVEPQAGQAGFAPQGRVGSIGGGYTQDDIADIPVLGESTCYSTWKQFLKKKQ